MLPIGWRDKYGGRGGGPEPPGTTAPQPITALLIWPTSYTFLLLKVVYIRHTEHKEILYIQAYKYLPEHRYTVWPQAKCLWVGEYLYFILNSQAPCVSCLFHITDVFIFYMLPGRERKVLLAQCSEFSNWLSAGLGYSRAAWTADCRYAERIYSLKFNI